MGFKYRVFPPLVELGDFLVQVGNENASGYVVEIQVWLDTVHFFRLDNGIEINAGRHKFCTIDGEETNRFPIQDKEPLTI